MEWSVIKTKRKLGPRDKRLQVRRCTNCRLGHRKCDDERPCSSCRIRNFSCEDGSSFRKNAEYPLIDISVQKGANKDARYSWDHYSSDFFDFLGLPSAFPLSLETFHPSHISEFIRRNEATRYAAIAIGSNFRCHRGQLLDVASEKDLSTISIYAYNEAQSGLKRMQEAKTDNSRSASAMCALLLHIYLLMTDDTALRLVNATDRVFRPLLFEYLPESTDSDLEPSLLRLLWMFDIVFAAEFDQDTFLADHNILKLLNGHVDLPSMEDPLEQVPSLDLSILSDLLIGYLTRLARLSARATAWVHRNRDGHAYPPLFGDLNAIPSHSGVIRDDTAQAPESERIAHLREGHYLFAKLTDLPRMLEKREAQAPPDSTSTPPRIPSSSESATLILIKIYMEAGMIGLTQVFADPLWVSQGGHTYSNHEGNLTPPTLARSIIEKKIVSTLSLIENRLSETSSILQIQNGVSDTTVKFCVGVEAVLYLPALTTLSLEVRCVTLRERVKNLFIAVQSRGFMIVSVVLHDVELAWLTTGIGCGEFCCCPVENGETRLDKFSCAS